MAYMTGTQRALLRQRLLAWASDQERSIPQETLSDQIEHLFEEVLHEPPAKPQALALREDEDEDDQRVVVTGIGVITPFGLGIAPFWAGLEAGRSAISPITLCDTHDLPCRIAGEVRHFEPQQFLSAKAARHMSRGSQFAVAAARLALDDAGLTINEDNSNEVGAMIACAAPSYPETEEAARTLQQRGPERINPYYVPAMLPGAAAHQVAFHFGLRGHTMAISTSSAQAVGEAAATIRRGDAVAMLAGGGEAPISRLGIAGMCAMRALSTRNNEPQRASRPFDAERDGFVPAEGAGVLVLERLSYARQRGASIYAEVVGYASTCDAYHSIDPDPYGDGAALAIRNALLRARIDPQQIDYISASAMGSRVGDLSETRAIKHVFGEYAASIPISAFKSMFGHLTGAAGSVEAAAALLALQHNILPPTINQEHPDPECDLDYVPNESRPAELQTVLTNSFALGGVNAVLLFQRLEDNG